VRVREKTSRGGGAQPMPAIRLACCPDLVAIWLSEESDRQQVINLANRGCLTG
jgi:hypothetical protein